MRFVLLCFQLDCKFCPDKREIKDLKTTHKKGKECNYESEVSRRERRKRIEKTAEQPDPQLQSQIHFPPLEANWLSRWRCLR